MARPRELRFNAFQHDRPQPQLVRPVVASPRCFDRLQHPRLLRTPRELRSAACWTGFSWPTCSASTMCSAAMPPPPSPTRCSSNADLTLLVSAMALVTKHLGFGITSNLTFEHPYQLARTFSTLDHLTKGASAGISSPAISTAARAAWACRADAHTTIVIDTADDFLTAVSPTNCVGRQLGARRRAARSQDARIHRSHQGPSRETRGAALPC